MDKLKTVVPYDSRNVNWQVAYSAVMVALLAYGVPIRPEAILAGNVVIALAIKYYKNWLRSKGKEPIIIDDEGE